MDDKSVNAKIKEILSNEAFQKTLSKLAVEKGISLVQANIEAEMYFQELFAEHDTTVNIGFIETFQYFIGKGFDKHIDCDASELRALAKLMRKQPVAFVMTHKSYIDLLVLMIVLARYGLPLPFMFSGINLDLPVVGKLARKNGVIFIRRSFRDNAIYKSTLRFFISHLLKQNSHFMWAIEGTRSRTGKMVWPQMGILKYIVEAEQDISENVEYVPVSIVYDLIPDVDDMTVEGRGAKKKPENIKWMFKYLRKLSSGNLGKISIRIGKSIEVNEGQNFQMAEENKESIIEDNIVPKLAFNLIQKINEITPITTISLICKALLCKFSLTKRGIESNVADLMQIIENHKDDTLVDRGMPIGESVQKALQLLMNAKIILHQGDGLHKKYTINRKNYLQATYYANMSVHHFYHRAFIELALLKVYHLKPNERSLAFWKEIMALRDFFKFEFFYSSKEIFSSEIEKEMSNMPGADHILHPKTKDDIIEVLKSQKILVAPVILSNIIEAYNVVAQGLLIWDPLVVFEEKAFLDYCLFLGEEMHWLGQIRRVEAVSKPFLQSGLRLASNLKLIPNESDDKKTAISSYYEQVKDISDRINRLQAFTLEKHGHNEYSVPVEREIIPGSKTESLTKDILDGEYGPHIGAFFDLDKTLIDGFSAKNFVKTRLMSGKFTSKELINQFYGVLAYAKDSSNFASMAAISAKGVDGIAEEVFIEVGEEVYRKELANSIFSESRALVAAHIAMGHTVTIVSAATPYQVEPIARDLGINIVMCTRLEVKNGKFTGKIVEPACWGEGKAIAGREIAKKYKLDLQKSYFYTDSAEDLPLLEIVGNPRAVNPDMKLSAIAFQNDWPIMRFGDSQNSRVASLIRTGLTVGVVVPAILKGLSKGASQLSFEEGVESMMNTIGDLGTAIAGIKMSVKGENHLWSHRPAVFILNHQSNIDFLIAIKLIRKDARGVAKKELQKIPIIGQILEAAGTIFLDRADKEKSINALKPAIDSLKNGTSVVIFPEGTRSHDYTLGKFKKGAFHLAMEAGVPIVPIVLKNAHDVMPRGKSIINPAMVEVIVLEPVLTHEWTKENLNDKIDEIRNKFLKELNQLEAAEIS